MILDHFALISQKSDGTCTTLTDSIIPYLDWSDKSG